MRAADVLVSEVPAAMLVVDPAWRVVYVNPAALDVLGAGSESALLGATLPELMAAAQRKLPPSRDGADRVSAAMERITGRLRRVLDQGETLRHEEVRFGVDPETGWPRVFDTAWFPVRDDRGEIAGAAVAAVDVTRATMTESLLRRAESRYRALVESTGLEVWTADLDGRMTSDTSWSGLPEDAVERLRHGGWLDMIHPDERERVRTAWRDAVRDGSVFREEFRSGLRARGYRRVIKKGVPVVDGSELVEFVGTTQDVTATRASEYLRAEAFVRARNVSLMLQRAMLPAYLPEVEELALGVRYVAGERGVEVGGDWYDVIPLSAGRVALVVGDVMGRGIEAATIMGQVRTAVRAYASLDMPPDQLMGYASQLVASLEAEPLVTAVYVIYDPWEGELQWVAAGHPTPLVKTPENAVLRLTEEPDPPLGVPDMTYRRHTQPFAPGSVLALYTDGLVETRGRSADEGIRQLVDWLDVEPVASLDELADGMIDSFARGPQQDDVALLLAAVTGADGGQVASLPAPAEGGGLHDLRARIAEVHEAFGVRGSDASDALVVANELVTNALVHVRRRASDAPVSVRMRRTPRRLHIEVFDPSHRQPVSRLAEHDDERGRGLMMVSTLTERWGTRLVSGGKYVWCTMRLGPDSSG